jgi:multiple sugar transport system permease protein
MFLAALQTIPNEHYEAALVDGANAFQCFWHVTLPGVKSISVFLFLLILIWTFGRAFAIIYVLTGGGPAGCTENIPLRGYIEAFQFYNFGTAAALGAVTLLISLAFSITYLWLLGREKA